MKKNKESKEISAKEYKLGFEGKEKKALTPGKLVEMFSEIRKKEFENDEVLLTRS